VTDFLGGANDFVGGALEAALRFVDEAVFFAGIVASPC
jgi:hypothetical protein